MLKQITALIALSLPLYANAGIIDLGAANGYNIFVEQNFSQPGADSHGKIAVGGNANIGQMDVGVNYDPDYYSSGPQLWTDPNSYDDVLVVGGDLTTSPWAWGNIKGNLILGGELTANSNTNAVLGTTTKDQPINFTAAFEQLDNLSQFLAGQSNTGGQEFRYNNWLLLNGSADVDVYFTSITGQMLANTTDLSATGLDQNDTLIINVSGKNINFDSLNYGQRESTAALDLSPSHILYNFFEAENITFSGGFKGNILAPNANFNFVQGDLSGQVIVKSWTGNWGAQANLWDGFFVPPIEPPPVIKVMESSSLVLLLAGLMALLVIRRIRA